jgi:hypothetical protein
MSRWRFLILFAAAATAECSALTPFATSPLAADPGVKDARPRVAICYNLWKTPPEKIQELAQVECLGGTVAEQIDTDYRLDNCPLMTPGRATFVCKPK